MANKNFTVQHGLNVGPLTIDAVTGNITTTGTVTADGITLDSTTLLTPTQNTLLDGITVSFAEVNHLAGVTSNVQTHIVDDTRHITAGQNSFLDAVTATATEVNYSVGTTSGIQAQLNTKLPLSGGTLTGTVSVSSGSFIDLASLPTSSNHAANKSYVDNLVSGSVTWRNPVVDPDVVDLVASNPATPEATYGITTGGNVAFIATASFTASYGTGATVSVVAGDIINLTITSSGNGDYSIINTPLAVGDRFILGAEHGSAAGIAAGALGALVVGGFALRKGDLIQLVAGNGTSAADWSTPEGRSGQAGGGTEISQGITVLSADPDSVHYGHSYLYNSAANAWTEISGPGSINAGTGLSYAGNTLNVNASQTQITAVGTLAGLATAGHIATTGTGTYDIGTLANKFGTLYGVATSAQYADLAEYYAADAEYAPGTVLMFGGDNEVTVCAADMSPRVAGVVTTNPAYLMNSDIAAEFKAAVALQGRVPCKVVGPVAKGDMMVAAGNGAARAEANPTMGSVIGKALENFDGAEGVIEVVVGRV